MNLSLTFFASALFVLTGASIAHLAVWPIIYGMMAGVFLIVFVVALRTVFKSDFSAALEKTSLVMLVVISAIISWKALLPLMSNTPIQIEKSLPSLFTTAALYVFYFLLNKSTASLRKTSVQDKLTGFFSGPPLILTAVMALIITTYVLIAIHYAQLHYVDFANIAAKFLSRGIIPPLTVLLFCWCALIIFNKTYILWAETRALNGKQSLQKSVLIQTYFQNLKNTGSTSADHFIDLLWKKSADFYIIPRYINWAIPILGFIGTVLGISLAAEGIQSIIASNQSFGQLSTHLGQAISPLGIAFDTTLIALSLSVLLMLLQTSLQKWEDNLLIDYETKIRNMPLHND
ncbi:MAG: hypothetical protein ACNYNY_04620 [Candidatus Oxydemutatoraceae bacterium WSBS_2016_MAG_OTU14]